MAKTNNEWGVSRKDVAAARWGGYVDGMARALEVAESELKSARRFYGEVEPETREGGMLEGMVAVVRALRTSPELEGWRV